MMHVQARVRIAAVILVAACPAAGAAQGAWPMFMHDAAHTGRSRYAGPRYGFLSWSYTTGGAIGFSSPSVGEGGMVCAGSSDNRLYVVESDGAFRWSYEASEDWQTCPAVGEGGGVFLGNNDNRMYALDSAGGLLWSYRTGWSVVSPPAIAFDGTVHFGSSDSRLYTLDPQGALRWSYSFYITGNEWVVGSPARITDGVAVATFDDRAYSLSSGGAFLWSYDCGDSIISSPAVDGGGRLSCGSMNGRVYVLEAGGVLAWSYRTGATVAATAAYASDGGIITASVDHAVYSLSSGGALVWSYTTAGQVGSSPALGSDGRIYIGSLDGALYALEPFGSLLWTYSTGGEVGSSPALTSDGRAVWGSTDGTIYCAGHRQALGKGYAYVVNLGSGGYPGSVSAVDVGERRVVETIGDAASPEGVAIAPAEADEPAAPRTLYWTGVTPPVNSGGKLFSMDALWSLPKWTSPLPASPLGCAAREDVGVFCELGPGEAREIYHTREGVAMRCALPASEKGSFAFDIDSTNSVLLVPNPDDDTVSAVDAASLTETARIAVGGGPDERGGYPVSARFYARPRYAFVANSGRRRMWGNVVIVDLEEERSVAAIETGGGPLDIAIDPLLVYAYATDYESGEVVKIDMIAGSVAERIEAGTHPSGIAVNPDGGALYVTNYLTPDDGYDRGVLKVIDLRGGAATDVAVGTAPGRLCLFTSGYRPGVTLDASPEEAGPGETVTLAWGVDPAGMPPGLASGDVYMGVRSWPGNTWSFDGGFDRLAYWGTSPVLRKMDPVARGFDFSSAAAGELAFRVPWGIAPGVYVFAAAVTQPGSSALAYLVQSPVVLVR